jgi:hypothetical protein
VLKRQGREADHSVPASAEVKKIWIYTSIPHLPHTPLWYSAYLNTGATLPFACIYSFVSQVISALQISLLMFYVDRKIGRADHTTPFYPLKLTLISPTNGGRSVGIVRSRTKAIVL